MIAREVVERALRGEDHPTSVEVRRDYHGRAILVHIIYAASPDVLILLTDQDDGAGDATIILLDHADRARMDADPANPYRAWQRIPPGAASAVYPVLGALVLRGREWRAAHTGAG